LQFFQQKWQQFHLPATKNVTTIFYGNILFYGSKTAFSIIEAKQRRKPETLEVTGFHGGSGKIRTLVPVRTTAFRGSVFKTLWQNVIPFGGNREQSSATGLMAVQSTEAS